METTDKKESIYLTVSESGVPIRFDWPHASLPEDILHKRFIEYLNLEIKVNSKDGYVPYIPDNRIQRYDLPGEGHLQKINDELSQGRSITDLLHELGAVKREDISFRAAYFHDQLIERITENTLPDAIKLSDGIFKDSLSESMYTEFNDDCKQAIELNSYMTEKGIVSFDDSFYGELYEKAYLQNLADSYFDPQRGTGDRLKAYKFYDPSEEQINYAVSIYKYFNILNLKGVPVIPLSKDLSLVTDPSEENKYDMSYSTYWNYSRFTGDFNLEWTPANEIIHEFMYLKENGYPESHDEVEPKVREYFSELETRLIDLHANDPHNDKILFELINKSQLLADNILKERYKIEGKPVVLINSNPKPLIKENTLKNRPQNKRGPKIK